MPNPFQSRLAMPITAKQAILSAFTATGSPLSTSQLTQCGVLLGVDAAAVRMAIGRMVKKRNVITVERGVHILGDNGRPIFDAMQRWIKLPNHTQPWRGMWVLVHTAHLGRVHRATLRRRERALSLLGFAALHNGLWIRPDNLSIDGPTWHKRLVGLGLEPEALVVDGANLLSPEPRISSLWDREAIESGYSDAKSAIEIELKTKGEKSVEVLARNTAQLGSAVIAMLSFDPLLPEELVNAGLRREVHESMLTLDVVAKQALQSLWDSESPGVK